jgi:hypothetical protein
MARARCGGLGGPAGVYRRADGGDCRSRQSEEGLVLPHRRMFPRYRVLPHQACSVASLVLRPSRSSSSVFINQCLLMLALWSCGRRVSVVQAQRQIHRAFRAVFTFAEVALRSIAKRAAFVVVRRNARIGSHGSEYHLVRGCSALLLQATLQRPKLPVRVDVGVLSLQPLQQFARCMPRLCPRTNPAARS